MSEKALSFGVCLQTYTPVRKEPCERAEMITQILFGESIEILDDEGRWLYIRMLLDSYEGWIDKKCVELTKHEGETVYLVFKNSVKLKNISSGQTAIAPIGASLPSLEEGIISLGHERFELDDASKLLLPGSEDCLQLAVQEVLSLPYLWGGRSGYGFDCSGLSQYLCRVAGVDIPRDASDQAASGATLSFMNEVKAGDLAFFDDTEGMIHHVGMLLGDGKIIHASGTVRIDNIDQQGIFNEQIGSYTHKLRVMKRV